VPVQTESLPPETLTASLPSPTFTESMPFSRWSAHLLPRVISAALHFAPWHSSHGHELTPGGEREAGGRVGLVYGQAGLMPPPNVILG
jgi:hypothetical protein